MSVSKQEILDSKTFVIKKAHFASQPLYSFVIPTYNRPTLLVFALNSILNQKEFDGNVEIVVCDNNPVRNDLTEQYMTGLQDKRISYYKHNENVGGVNNWTHCCYLAQGQWVIMLHDDDMLYDDYFISLKKIMSLYSANDYVAFFPSFNSLSFDSDQQPARSFGKIKTRVILEKDFLEGCILACPLGMCVNKKAFAETDGFDPDAIPAIDYEFYVRLSRIGKIVKMYGYPLGTWRIMDNDSKNEDVMLMCLQQMKSIQAAIIEHSKMHHIKWIIRKYDKYFDYQHIKFWHKEMKGTMPPNNVSYSIMDRICYSMFKLCFVMKRHLRSGSKTVSVQ